MIEKVELSRAACRGRDEQPLHEVSFQFFETVATDKGSRRRPGAIRLELNTGEAVRQIDKECFEVIETGELIMIAPDSRSTEPETAGPRDIPLCRNEELARQENRLREADPAGKNSSELSVQAARSSSAGPKNS